MKYFSKKNKIGIIFSVCVGFLLLYLIFLAPRNDKVYNNAGNVNIDTNAVLPAASPTNSNRKISDSLLANCPMKIKKYWLSHNDIGTPQVNIIYKNISKKKIDAFDITALCFDNYGEPVNGSVNNDNIYQGIDQDNIAAGKTGTDQWNLYTFDNTTKIIVAITRVHFKGGGGWNAEP